MRATLEIQQLLRAAKDIDSDKLQFCIDVLLTYLPYEEAKEFFAEGVDYPDEEDWFWNPPTEQERVARQEMAEYMHLAWKRLVNHDTIGCTTSVIKISIWDWLLSDEGKELDPRSISYPKFGAPYLLAICRKHRLQIPQSVELQNMMQGQPCKLDCTMGCV